MGVTLVTKKHKGDTVLIRLLFQRKSHINSYPHTSVARVNAKVIMLSTMYHQSISNITLIDIHLCHD